MLSPEDIIRGAYFAMEQAGLLLSDAALLYRERHWPSSLALAVLSLEELGKAETLLAKAIEAAQTGAKTREQIMDGMNAHQRKLRVGRSPLTVTVGVQVTGDIPEPNTKEAAELEKRLEDAKRIALEQAPKEAHGAKMRALYVDLTESGWSRPAQTRMDEAYSTVAVASIEYEVRRRKYLSPEDPHAKKLFDKLKSILPRLPDAPVIEWSN